MNIKKTIYVCLLSVFITPAIADKQQETVANAINLIKQDHAYLSTKPIDMECIEESYHFTGSKTPAQEMLILENLMLEFADNHIHLNANNQNSYRIFGPAIVEKINNEFVISDFWKNNMIDTMGLQVGAQLISLNNQSPKQIIEAFPTQCLNKSSDVNQQWIINKTLAGIYSKPRLLKLKAGSNVINVDLDAIQKNQHQTLLSYRIEQEIGIITINDSLGQTDLIAVFDAAINDLQQTNGLILDLRNTASGGDTYMARAIISRLINQAQPYQKHRFEEQRNGAVKITRSWVEYVEPRSTIYTKPLVVLVNHWTGSMGEGLAIGLQGMNRATIIGTKMAGLLGAINGYPLLHLNYGFQMPIERLYRVDNTPRELVVPDLITRPDNTTEDNILATALSHLLNQN